MKSGADILNELESISPLMAGMTKTNVYAVPAGYFEDLADTLLFASKAEESRVLVAVKEENNNSVPEGYFDTLADTILSKIREQEKNSSGEISEMLQSIQSKNVYQVPNGYFNRLSDTILNKLNTPTAAEEIRTLSPMLYSIQNESIFEVPKGYFTAFAEDMLNKVKPAETKVVVMHRRSVWLKYAVAAAFIGVMSFGAFKFINQQEKSLPLNYAAIINTNVDGELAKISEAEIENFLIKDGVDVESAVAFAQLQEKATTDETTDKTESDEIDDLLKQMDDNKTMN